VAGARAGKLKGWSFGMKKIIDKIEERVDSLPLRHVKDFDLDHITLVMRKSPAYAATSIELRADDSMDELETRAGDTELSVTDMVETPKEPIDYSKYDTRIQEIRAGK
jgi:phage head maturation protease